jgi:hypothetical protein
VSTTPAFRRRVFLLGTIGAGVSLMQWSPWSWPFLAPDNDLSAERLVDVLAHRETAAALGGEYLRLVPGEADAGVLRILIVRSLSGSTRSIERPSKERLREWVRRTSIDDFEQEHTFKLDGWILARTEARLCALAAASA